MTQFFSKIATVTLILVQDNVLLNIYVNLYQNLSINKGAKVMTKYF